MGCLLCDSSNNATLVLFATSPQAALIDGHTKQHLVESFAVVAGMNGIPTLA
jgi:hypothetical protein